MTYFLRASRSIDSTVDSFSWWFVQLFVMFNFEGTNNNSTINA